MSDKTKPWRAPIIAVSWLVCSFLATAQEVALITALKGEVTLKKGTGEVRRAAIKDGLLPGEELTTAVSGTASVLYYTGEEIVLGAGKTYVVAQGMKEESFLKRLASVFSNLIWSKKKTNSVLGSSRGFEPKTQSGLLGVYPSFNIVRGPVIPFEWIDSREKDKRSYVVSLRNEHGGLIKTVTVTDANRVLLPVARLDLATGATYRWEVRDQIAKLASQEISFSFLPEQGNEALEQSRRKLMDVCKNDTTQFRYTLLEAMLYLDSNLIMQAESTLLDLVKLKPDFVVGHEMLAEVYRRVGKIDDANAELKAVRSILENQQ